MIRELFSMSCAGTSAQTEQRLRQFSATPRAARSHRHKEERTVIQVVLEAYAHLALRVSRDGQPRLAVDILLVQVHVLLRTRVDNLNVDALVDAGPDICGNNHEGVQVGRVPNAF